MMGMATGHMNTPEQRKIEKLERERDALRAAVRHEADCVEARKEENERLREALAQQEASARIRGENCEALRAELADMKELCESGMDGPSVTSRRFCHRFARLLAHAALPK